MLDQVSMMKKRTLTDLFVWLIFDMFGLKTFKPIWFLFPFVSDNDNEWEIMNTGIGRHSAEFYQKSANLIGFPTVFYSLIENSHMHIAL